MKAHQASQSDTDNDVSMTEDDNKSDDTKDDDDVSWLHVASYAIHKLFDSWDSDGSLTDSVNSFLDSVRNIILNYFFLLVNLIHDHFKSLFHFLHLSLMKEMIIIDFCVF